MNLLPRKPVWTPAQSAKAEVFDQYNNVVNRKIELENRRQKIDEELAELNPVIDALAKAMDHIGGDLVQLELSDVET